MFDFWKEINQDFTHKIKLLNPLLNKLNFQKVKVGFYQWKIEAQNKTQNIKYHFYIHEEARKQYLQTIFSNFQQVLRAEKYARWELMRKTWRSFLMEIKLQKQLKNSDKILDRLDESDRQSKLKDSFQKLI